MWIHFSLSAFEMIKIREKEKHNRRRNKLKWSLRFAVMFHRRWKENIHTLTMKRNYINSFEMKKRAISENVNDHVVNVSLEITAFSFPMIHGRVAIRWKTRYIVLVVIKADTENVFD